MNLEERNRILPQMAEYDRVGDQWVPYLMRFDRPNRAFPSVSTGAWGTRNTVASDGEMLNVGKPAQRDQPFNIMLGSSTVFGVGATHDRFTIPSRLSQMKMEPWLNLGGRAFNSTQEWIILMLHLPPRIGKILVLSGVNNLTLAFLSSRPSPIYNSFFAQSTFEQTMADPKDEFIGVRRAAERLLKELRHKFWPEPRQLARASLTEVYDTIMQCLRRDLICLKSMADGLRVPIYFALQPMATWIERVASEQESRVFSLLDEMSMDWEVLARYLIDTRDRYFADVEATCSDVGIPFYNMNFAPEFCTSETLFVDRVHLTDLGYERAARVLLREFAL